MPDPRFENAKRLAEQGKYSEALSQLKILLQGDPHDDEARAFLLELQDRMMLEMQVQEKLRKVKELLSQGQPEPARKILHEIQRIAPGHGETSILLRGLDAPAAPAPFAPDALEPLSVTAPFEPGSSDPFSLEELPLVEEARPAESAAAPPPPGRPDELAPFSFDLPGESFTDQQQQISDFGPQLGPAEIAKVQQYIREGQAHFDQGHYQDAIDCWTRVFIVDENHQTAQALIEKAKEKLTQHQAQVEHYLTEGVALFNAGDTQKASLAFEKILAAFPGHREAQHYLSMIRAPKPAPPPVSAQQLEPSALPVSSAEGLGDFELQDDLTVPTGPELRAGTDQGGEFQFETGGDEMSFADVAPAASAPSEAAADEFTWDEGPDAAQAAPPPPPPPPFPLTVPAAPGGAAVPTDGLPAPQAPPQVVHRPPAAVKKAGKGLGIGVVLGVLAAMIVLGVGIFFGARLLMGRGDTVQGSGAVPPTGPANSAPANKPPEPEPPPSTPADPMAALSVDQLLAGARESAAARDHRKAMVLYQEVLTRDPVNGEALDGLSQTKAAIAKQEEEDARNEKFIKSYQAALTSFQEQDYQSSLAVAWRLIYPDDSLAKQLGKREAVARLIRDGYYNWAIQDLRSDNPKEASDKLKDLLDFDRSDGEARSLHQFAQKYSAQGTDDAYRQAVRNLKYRTFSESP